MSDRDTLFKTYTLKETIRRCERFCGSLRGDGVQSMRDWVNDVIANIMDATSHRFMLETTGFDTDVKYDTGTAEVTKGSATVTLTGAVFTNDWIGRKLYVPSHDVGYPIAAVSDPDLTLDWEYQKESASGIDYQIIKDTYGLAADFDRPKVADQHYTNLNLMILENLPVPFRVSDRPRLCKILSSDPANASTLLAMQLYPAPDRVMRVEYEYYRKYTKLSSDSSTIQIPDQFMNAICFGVAELYWLTQGDSGVALRKSNAFHQRYNAVVGQMIASKYRNDGKLVQFRSYQQVGVSNPAGEWGDWHPESLI